MSGMRFMKKPLIALFLLAVMTACAEDEHVNRPSSGTHTPALPSVIAPDQPIQTISDACRTADLETSPEHCGHCDSPCSDDQICIAGQCIDCSNIHCQDVVECRCGNKTSFAASCHYIVHNCSDSSDYVMDSDAFSADSTAPKNTAIALAHALDICMPRVSANTMDAGILEATLTQSAKSSNALVDRRQINLVDAFTSESGNTRIIPRNGNTFIVLSTGEATDAAHNASTADAQYTTDQIMPYTYRMVHNRKIKTHDACPSASKINDAVRLHLKLRAPVDAASFSFDFRFFTHEYPYYLCTIYNDMFVAILTDENGDPFIDTDHDGYLTDEDGNVSFDSDGNPISINSAFFTSCQPPACHTSNFLNAKEKTGCPPSIDCQKQTCGQCHDDDSGSFTDLYAFTRTPFPGGDYTDSHARGGATAWLTTTVPISGAQVFNLDFYIWDTTDQRFDSTVLIDNFRWNCFSVDDVSTTLAGVNENSSNTW